jgi:Leucine-rich repeat (LRR) protein
MSIKTHSSILRSCENRIRISGVTAKADDDVFAIFVSRLLQNNNVTGRLPPELGALPRLQTLDLSNNRLSGRVPDTLGHLSTLRYLCVSLPSSRHAPSNFVSTLAQRNGYSSCAPRPALSCRRRLNNNSLSGPFPASLAKIPPLTFL